MRSIFDPSVPQKSWIQSLPLRENITFGTTENTDEDRLQNIINACALRQDVNDLAAGDR